MVAGLVADRRKEYIHQRKWKDQTFAKKCMKGKRSFSDIENVLAHTTLINSSMVGAFKSSFEMPSLISSHISRSNRIKHLVKHATTQSLIIYVHREGTNRLRSAIGQVAVRKCEEENNYLVESTPEKIETCKLKEEAVMNCCTLNLPNESNRLNVSFRSNYLIQRIFQSDNNDTILFQKHGK
jgi:hypothetical protein